MSKKKPAKKSKSKNKKQTNAPNEEAVQEVPSSSETVDNLDAKQKQTDQDFRVPDVPHEAKTSSTVDAVDMKENQEDAVVPKLRSVVQESSKASSDDGIQAKHRIQTALHLMSRSVDDSGTDTDSKPQLLKTRKPQKKKRTVVLKHPLQDTWTFWYYQGIKTLSWNDNLKRVWDFNTVEDFWALYNEVVEPSCLSPGRDFNFFKKDIRPEWEDVHNRRGGMWWLSPRDRRSRMPEMDRVWKEILMFIIGDQFKELSPLINGITYSARKSQDRISLWIGADIGRKKEILEIGSLLREALGHAGSSFVLEYATSDDWKNKSGSSVIARFSI